MGTKPIQYSASVKKRYHKVAVWIVPQITIKGLFVEVMPSANNVAKARSFLQRHFYNVILIRRIILIFAFRSKSQA